MDRLVARYARLGTPVTRAGRAWPVALVAPPAACRAPGATPAAPLDGLLSELGAPHLRAALAGSPGAYDGPALVQGTVGAAGMTLTRAGYFAMLATCDALRAEAEADPAGPWPLRERADEVAGSDPLRCGTGRAAAVGVTGILLGRTPRGLGAVVGRRAAGLPLDPGRWHFVPSGTAEPLPDADAADVLTATIVRELAEEAPGAGDATVEPLGVGVDLLRLRPEACFRLTSGADAAAIAHAAGDGEYEDLEVVEAEDLHTLWTRDLTPAASICLALGEAAAASG